MLKQRQEKLGQRELQQLNQAAAELQHESWKRCLNMEGKEEERSEDLNVNIMPEMTEEVPDSDPHSTSKQGDHNVSLEHSYWLRLSGMRTPKSTSKDLIRLLPRIWVRSTQQGDNIEPTETYGDPQICVQLVCSNPPVNWNARYLATGNTPLLHCLERGEVEFAKILFRNPRVGLNIQNKAKKFPETITR